jgi:hypothetical protein
MHAPRRDPDFSDRRGGNPNGCAGATCNLHPLATLAGYAGH